jgi:hypothetical protein
MDLIKKFFRKDVSHIAQILSTETTREELLGMQTPVEPSKERILEDANRIVNYSTKADYRVWSKEAWSKALGHLDAIQEAKASTEQIHFHRGALKATLDLLRVSYQARAVKMQLEQEDAE